MSPPRLLHMGGAVVDLVFRIAALPSAGAESLARDFITLPGGGFNMMLAARRSGLGVAYGGGHGTGPNGSMLRAAMAEAGIACLRPPTAACDSGVCVVLVTDDAERTFVTYAGAETHATREALAPIAPAAGDWVFVSGYTASAPGAGEAMADWLDALADDVRVVFDPAPLVADIPGDILSRLLRRCTWLSCNQREAGLIAGTRLSPSQAASTILERCPQASGVVIRLGANGLILARLHLPTANVPAFAVRAVDTTGAGDTHIGAFVSALAQGEGALQAARYANAASALAVMRPGGAAAPCRREVLDFLQERMPGTTTANAEPLTCRNN